MRRRTLTVRGRNNAIRDTPGVVAPPSGPPKHLRLVPPLTEDKICMEEVKKKLTRLEGSFPPQMAITYEFARVLANRLASHASPKEFAASVEGLITDAMKKDIGMLSGYSSLMYLGLRNDIIKIVRDISPPDFAEKAVDEIKTIRIPG